MKSLKTKIKRVISTILCTALLFCSIVGVHAKPADEQTRPDTNQSISILPPDLISIVNPYVSLDNSKYVLNLPHEVSEKLTSAELSLINESINNANNFIALNKEKVKIDEDKNECTVTIPDSDLNSKPADENNNSITANGDPLTTGGETKVISHWWGLSIFLSSSMVKSLVLGEVAGLAALISLIPGAGWSVASAIAAAIAGDWVANQSYAPCVCQVSWGAVAEVRYGDTLYILPQIPGYDYSNFFG